MSTNSIEPQRNEIIRILLNLMQNNQGLLRLESDFAVEHLEKIARHATEAQCDTIITALVNKLENSRSEQEARTFVALWNLVPHVTKPRSDLIINALTSHPNLVSYYSFVKFFVSESGHSGFDISTYHRFSQAQLHMLFNAFMVQANKDIDTLGLIASYDSSKVLETVFCEFFLNRLNNTPAISDEDYYKTLTLVLRYVSKERREAIISSVLKKLNYDRTWTNEKIISHFSQIAPIAPYVSGELPRAVIEIYLINLRALDDFSFPAIFELRKLIPHASETQKKALISVLLMKLNRVGNALSGVFKLLKIAAPLASETQCQALLEALKNRLGTNFNSTSIEALTEIAHHVSQENRYSTIVFLISLLNHPNISVTPACIFEAVDTLLSTLSGSQLQRFIKIPTEGIRDELSFKTLQLFAETRLQMNRLEFELAVQEPTQARTLRFFSKAGADNRATDDCFTQIPEKTRTPYHEI